MQTHMSPNRPWKEYFFTVWEMKQEVRVLFDLPWKHAYQVTQLFCTLIHVHESLKKFWKDWFGGHKYILAIWIFKDMESVNNENWLYTSGRWIWWNRAKSWKLHQLFICWQGRLLNLPSCSCKSTSSSQAAHRNSLIRGYFFLSLCFSTSVSQTLECIRKTWFSTGLSTHSYQFWLRRSVVTPQILHL